MTDGGRFCIRCGREFGESLHCLNPDCGGIPNFYRNVAAPQPGAGVAPPSGTMPSSIVRTSTDVPGLLEGLVQDLDLTPVAYLRSVPRGREEPLFEGPIEVGAGSTAGIHIDHPEVSSRHARMECRRAADSERDAVWVIEVTDLGSRNGTFVNGKRIDRARLSPGDRVRFASAEFELSPGVDEGPRVTLGS